MYIAPYMDASGLHIPSYTDIRDQLILDAKSIFGPDIYLEPDSMDYQYISSIAQYLYDNSLLAQYVYNSMSPSKSVGTTLDSVVKINGLKRISATYSTCPVVLTGIAGHVITNGIVGDTNGINWDLPTSVTLDVSGNATVTATCEIPGAITAGIGTITTIVTPTYGWNTVNNTVAATVGTNTEGDGALRARQSISTAQPSQSITEGITSAILAVPGVTRVIVYENDTNSTDANGLPAHSLTCVVEGGSNLDIAKAIFIHKPPGCYTNGTTSQTVTDKYGNPSTMRFYRPTYIDIDVVINLKGLSGYTTDTTTSIKVNEAAYLNSLSIGADLSISSLWGIGLQAMPNLAAPLFSITSVTAAKHSLTQGTADIVTAFNEVTRGNVSYVTINVS